VFPSPVTWAWTCMMPSKRRTPDAWGVRIKCEECMMLVDFTLFRRGWNIQKTAGFLVGYGAKHRRGRLGRLILTSSWRDWNSAALTSHNRHLLFCVDFRWFYVCSPDMQTYLPSYHPKSHRVLSFPVFRVCFVASIYRQLYISPVLGCVMFIVEVFWFSSCLHNDGILNGIHEVHSFSEIHTRDKNDLPNYFLFASSSHLIPNRSSFATLLPISTVISSGTKKKGI
jgi:hypothetical protein